MLTHRAGTGGRPGARRFRPGRRRCLLTGLEPRDRGVRGRGSGARAPANSTRCASRAWNRTAMLPPAWSRTTFSLPIVHSPASCPSPLQCERAPTQPLAGSTLRSYCAPLAVQSGPPRFFKRRPLPKRKRCTSRACRRYRHPRFGSTARTRTGLSPNAVRHPVVAKPAINHGDQGGATPSHGATGNVGGELVELLRARHVRVHAISREPRAWPDGVQGVVGDANDPATLVGAAAGMDGAFR